MLSTHSPVALTSTLTHSSFSHSNCPARAAEQRIADKNPKKFRDANGALKNKHILQRLVLEELTRRGTSFQFLNTVRHRDDFFCFRAQEVLHATVLTRQSFPAGRKILCVSCLLCVIRSRCEFLLCVARLCIAWC